MGKGRQGPSLSLIRFDKLLPMLEVSNLLKEIPNNGKLLVAEMHGRAVGTNRTFEDANKVSKTISFKSVMLL